MSFVTHLSAGRRLPRKAWLLAHGVLLSIEVAALLLFAEPWAVIRGFSIDDAWIHQVVARTFAETGTLGYAPGKFGAGATSYLWAAMLSANYRWLHVDPAAYTLALNVALYLGSGAVLLSMALRDGLGEPRAISPWFEAAQAVLVVALASIGGNYLWFAFSGMEATLVVFLSAAAIACVTRRPSPEGDTTSWASIGAGAAVALLALARPETMALGPLLALASHRLGHRKKDTVILAACWLGAATVYFGANLAATGSALPATLGGRKWIWVGGYDGLLRVYLLWDFVCAWVFRLRNYTLGTSSDVALWISFGVAVLGAVRLARGRSWGLLLTVGWGLVHAAIYLVLLPTLGHGGRYQPLVPLAHLLLVGVGSIAILEEIVWALEKLTGRRFGWVGACLEGASLAPWAALVLVGVRDWSHDHAKAVVHIRTTELGLGPLVDALPPDAKVASFDIGGIGFASHRRILDIGGLSEPGTAELLKTGTIWKYLRDQHVEYVVVPEEYDTAFPGSLNFLYRLQLRNNPAVSLHLLRALESPGYVWLPAIRATAGSAPRQALYRIEFTGKPGLEVEGRTPSPIELEDVGSFVTPRERALLDRAMRSLAGAGIRVRLTLAPARGDDTGSTPDDAWWVQIGPWGVEADPPRRETRVQSAQATALLLDKLQAYVDIADFGGAAMLSLHVLVDVVRRWVDPDVEAMLPPASLPGMPSEGDAVLAGLPLGAGCMTGILVLAFGVGYFRRGARTRAVYVTPGVAVAAADVVRADAI